MQFWTIVFYGAVYVIAGYMLFSFGWHLGYSSASRHFAIMIGGIRPRAGEVEKIVSFQRRVWEGFGEGFWTKIAAEIESRFYRR
jgi:hypothetical protein